MFILYAVPLGLAAGLLLGGRVDGLAGIRFRWAWLILGALIVQAVLFIEPITRVVPDSLGVALYVTSTVVALVGVTANWRIPGIPLVALGASCNLAAIVANGGYMPADPAALAGLGRYLDDAYSNSTVVADPSLPALTDIFAMPSWMPVANVFSVGDVLIGLGVVITIAMAMRRSTHAARPAEPAGDRRTSSTPA